VTSACSRRASGTKVFSVLPGTGSLWRYDGGTSWSPIGGPVNPRELAVNGDGRLFGLTSDRQKILRYEEGSSTWTAIGGAADAITAGGRYVYATPPDRRHVLRHDGATWSEVATQPSSTPLQYVANDVTLYRGGLGVLSRLDSDGRDSWDTLDSAATSFHAGGHRLVVKHANGALVEVTGP
jgi:hypothetical protein